jgi:hypothetical protein
MKTKIFMEMKHLIRVFITSENKPYTACCNNSIWGWNKTTKMVLIFFLIVSSVLSGMPAYAQQPDRPPAEDEVDYFPGDGETIAANPPAFRWLPVEGINNYFVQYSRSANFQPDSTTKVSNLGLTVHIPTEVLQPGIWYWRYGFTGNEKEVVSKTRSFVIPEDAVVFPFIPVEEVISRIPKDRPRLHFSPKLVEEIRSDADGRFSHITNDVINEAGQILEMNEPLFEEPKMWDEYDDPNMAYVNAWRSMRPYTQRMVTSALAYIYTGEERFALEAKRRLMHFMSWNVEGPSSAIWPTELGMDIAENCPPVFDWIYDILTEKERKICLEVLAARMHQISYDVHRSRPMETKPFSSHPGRMVGFIVEGSIVLAHEVSEVSDWLDYTLKLLWSTYPAWGKSEGGWHEGISYWGGYMRRMFRAVTELDRMGIPLKEKPFFQNTGYFGLYAAYPKRPTRAFGDSHESPVGESHGQLMYNLSTLYRNPWFRWHAEVFGITHSSRREAFLYYDPDLKARSPIDIPQSHVFRDVGLAAMHSNMPDPDNNVTMIFQSNPFGAISHNFASQNAFVIEAYGEPLAISTGARQLHGSPHHRQWMWHTKAHNSILVDNEGQVTRTRNSSGEIINYAEEREYAFVTGDATRAYGGRLDRFHRHILFIRPDYFIIIDDLKTSGKESTFQWLLHSPAEIRVNQEKNLMVNQSGNVRLTSRFLTPGSIEYVQHTGFTPQVVDSLSFQNQFHLTASTREPFISKKFVTVMHVDKTDGPAVEKPGPPSTPRKELEIKNIENVQSLDRGILNARLLEAKGGMAIRLGNDLILWRDQDSWKVEAEGIISTRQIEVRKDFFQNK